MHIYMSSYLHYTYAHIIHIHVLTHACLNITWILLLKKPCRNTFICIIIVGNESRPGVGVGVLS